MKPQPHAACRAEFGEAVEDGADGAGNGFLGVQQHFAVGHPRRRRRAVRAAVRRGRFVAYAGVEPGADDVQFGLGHGSFKSEQQTVVEQRRMINVL
jgi:hypothetical protein